MLKDEVIKHLKEVEGIKNLPYKDSKGYWTIGIGHLITRDKTISKDEAFKLMKCAGDVMSDEEINEQLLRDMASVVREIEDSKTLFNIFSNLMSESQKVGLLSMCFQLGVYKTSLFNDAWAAFELGNMKEVKHHLSTSGIDPSKPSKWIKDTPARARKVIKMIVGE